MSNLKLLNDPYFKVAYISHSLNPMATMNVAMHQDYSEQFVMDEWDDLPEEFTAGERLVKNLLKGDRGHFGVLEHSFLCVNVGYFPHSTMQQLRTHRVGVSFDVQSMRYTGKRLEQLATYIHCEWNDDNDGIMEAVERTFYVRPVGIYNDRQGDGYHWTDAQRKTALRHIIEGIVLYGEFRNQGVSEEHARGYIPFDFRQHFVLSGNVRSFWHMMDLRWKADAQLECQEFCRQLEVVMSVFFPQLQVWYNGSRARRAKLAP